jgi:hypothetical protein
MKNIFFTFCFCAFTIIFSNTQLLQSRNIRIPNLGNDSTNLSLNDEYFLIEDSCAQIVRYGHVNMRKRIFFGPFKDVSKSNPGLVVSEGNYTAAGLKDGDFISHYINGNMQAKGNYKENKFNGRWQLFYPGGKTKLIFDAAGDEIKIVDAWDDAEKKSVDNGNGNYSVKNGNIVWSGKLNNGTPDGQWNAARELDRTNTILVKEKFKNGKFIKGNGPGGDYTDASHIYLINEADLPFINAENLRISSVPCNGVKRKQIVGAQYKDGFAAFNQKIKDLINPYLSTVDIKPYNVEVEINGEISEKGDISKLAYTGIFDEKIASGLIRELSKLPFLEPALVDGKPVTQKIIFKFNFMSGLYRFNYRLVPLNIN